jgi:hypothetical protein
VVHDAYLRIKALNLGTGGAPVDACVDKELLMSTYQCQKLKKALLSTIIIIIMKMKGWKDKTTEI